MKWYLILTLFDPNADPEMQYTLQDWGVQSEEVCYAALENTKNVIEEQIEARPVEMRGVTYELYCEER